MNTSDALSSLWTSTAPIVTMFSGTSIHIDSPCLKSALYWFFKQVRESKALKVSTRDHKGKKEKRNCQ